MSCLKKFEKKSDNFDAELVIFDKFKIQIVHNDITYEEVDAITNAANSHLMHGAGVAGAIRRAGGPNVQKESTIWIEKNGIVPIGCCTVTKSGQGQLLCRYIIHTVGPVWGEHSKKDNIKLLESCVVNTLEMAKYLGIKSVSLPAISSGIFGFPKDKCAKIMIEKSV